LLRAFNRWFPGNLELANQAYPDDTSVIERLRDCTAPATVTRCNGGVPNLIYPKRYLGDPDEIARIEYETLTEHYETEGEKDRVFDIVAARIRAAAANLQLALTPGMTGDELQARWDAFRKAVDESLMLREILGEGFGSRVFWLVRETLLVLIDTNELKELTRSDKPPQKFWN